VNREWRVGGQVRLDGLTFIVHPCFESHPLCWKSAANFANYQEGFNRAISAGWAIFIFRPALGDLIIPCAQVHPQMLLIICSLIVASQLS